MLNRRTYYKNEKCIDCNKLISNRAKKCRSCSKKGHLLSNESREKIRKTLTGHKLSKETCKKLSEARKKEWELGIRKGSIHTEEHKRNIGLGHKGEKSWRWISDRTLLKMGRNQAYDYRYRDWMKQVKNRDGWKCRISNKNCEGKLEAHHILSWRDLPELRYEINNGISLCHVHHPRKRDEEQKLVPFFNELVLITV